MRWPWQRADETSPQETRSDADTGGRGETPGPVPAPEEFTRGAIERAVLAEALQHPLTILPAAVGGVALLWSTMIDLSPASLMAILASGFVAASSWAFQYFIRGETIAARHVEDLRRRRAEGESGAAAELEQRCQQAGFDVGAKEVRELGIAYEKLRRHLEEASRTASGGAAARFAVLAQETHREGIGILRHALQLFSALRSVDVQALEAELGQWRRQVENRPAPDQGKDALTRQIEAHQKRLELYRQRRGLIDDLLAEANELESVLDTTYLELIELTGTDAAPALERREAVSRLETAVEAARRVEQRLRALEGREHDADDEYLRAVDPAGERRS